MTRIEVCSAAELLPGERRIVEVDGLPHSVGVFNVAGDYHALANVCPHHLAPLCEGTVTGEMTSEGVGDFRLEREGEIIQCPWHGWKFDIADGRSVFNPHLGTRTYEARVEQAGTRENGEDAPRSDDAEAADGPGDDSTAAPPETDDEGGDAAEEEEEYGAALMGDEPPVESYDVAVERDVVVLYV